MSGNPSSSIESSRSNSICVTKFEWDDEIRKGPLELDNDVLILSRQIGVPDEDMNSLIKFDFKLFYLVFDGDENRFYCFVFYILLGI